MITQEQAVSFLQPILDLAEGPKLTASKSPDNPIMGDSTDIVIEASVDGKIISSLIVLHPSWKFNKRGKEHMMGMLRQTMAAMELLVAKRRYSLMKRASKNN